MAATIAPMLAPVAIPSLQSPNLTRPSMKSPSPEKQTILLSSTDTTQKAYFMYNFGALSHGYSLQSTDYASAIESCDCLRMGRQIHAHALKRQYCHSSEFLETKLLVMYGRCASVEAAGLLFEKMLFRNLYAWAGILTVYVDHGYFEAAILLLQELLEEEKGLEFFIFPVVLKACTGLSALKLGRQLHGFVLKREFISNIYVGNALIDMYGKCESLDEAIAVLKKMPETDRVSWNSVITSCAANGMVFGALDFFNRMQLSGIQPNLVSWSAAIGGFAHNGYDKEALELLNQMQESGIEPNAQTLATVLPACARLQILSIGKEIHGYIMRHEFMFNSFVVNGLVDVYRRCGDMGSALKIFSRFSARNLVSCNTMIVGYCEDGDMEKAKDIFDRVESYGVKKDTISWNSMISGYRDNGQFEKTLEMFRHMQVEEGVRADSFTLGSALTACADMAALPLGKEIHSFAIARGLHSNAFVGGALVEMYCKCQDLVSAWLVFERITERDTTTWNALISGYARCDQMEHVHELLSMMRTDGLDPNIYTWNGILAGYVENGYNESALQLFAEMQIDALKPDIYTMCIVLVACSRLMSTRRGKQVHAHLIRGSWDSDVHIGSAIVDIYAKCGSIRYAKAAFYRISQPNLVAYNAMLTGYAIHGLVEEGIGLFHQLMLDGVQPDAITFLSVLSSCTHGGLIKEGCEYFGLMASYGMEPELKHYTCMIDLFSRAGLLREALGLVHKMPMKNDAVVWGALLGGCVIHRNVELGEIVAKRLIELDGDNAGNHVMLANLYAAAGRLGDFAKMRQFIKDAGMQKSPGCSCIEERNQVHVFRAGDTSHKQTSEIYATLEILNLHLRNE